MKNILEEVQEKIRKTNLLDKKDRIVLGCSGGADSIFLLEVLLSLKDEYELDIILVHINHLYRGDEALRDENFVRSLGEKYKLKVYVKQKSMTEMARIEKISLEEAGREIRHGFFREVFNLEKANKIATAHNLDDQVETFMFRLMRGSSFEGLNGIIDKRDEYIRPINEVYKKDIEEYLNLNNISFVVDSTNLENDYTRNSIRLDLIPLIEEKYNPKFKEKIYKFIKEIREVNEILDLDYSSYIINNEIKIESLKNERKYIKGKILNHYLNLNNISVSREKISNIISILEKNGSKEIKLDKENILIKEYKRLYIKNIIEVEDDLETKVFKIPGEVRFGRYIIRASEVKPSSLAKENIFETNLKKEDVLLIRSRKEGDIISLKGMEKPKKIKDILINLKFPKEQRDKIPLVIDFKTEKIIWLSGLKKSEIYFKEEGKESIYLSIEKV